ncbi:NAD(+)/NADH kinase [Paraflavitalea speifideaquila]|uniref:NAD(+)/NADH kinase n=1 Tax=Paraflavitalea speifideaquila TaxID=3076558 RepID=UPI0028E6CF8C|nr:NAD(+)/NADH kinase [Paraflavitalea speifideiaquila]
MKVAIYSRVIDYDQKGEVQQLFDELGKENMELVIYEPFYETIRSSFRFPDKISVFRDSNDLTANIDFLISLGGDGTLLDTVTLVRNKNIPVLGINFGRLGFWPVLAVQSYLRRYNRS